MLLVAPSEFCRVVIHYYSSHRFSRYVLISLIFGIFMMATFALAVYNVVYSDDIVLSSVGIAAVASYVLVAFLHCEVRNRSPLP